MIRVMNVRQVAALATLAGAAMIGVIGCRLADGFRGRDGKRPEPARRCGFNLLGMFCQTKQTQGDALAAGRLWREARGRQA